MNILNNKEKEAQEISIKQKKQQEFKFIGSVRRKKGQTLFAVDPQTREVYKVPMERRVALDLSNKKEVAKTKAVVDPAHPLIWALNIKNAKRKLKC